MEAQKIRVKSPVGELEIHAANDAIVAVYFPSHRAPEAAERATPLLKKAKAQMEDYFRGKRKDFDLPLAPEGTAFQKKVWKALQGIPYGETRSYAQIAAKVGKPKAARAVGGANNRNPIGLIVPCHRVIGASGDMVGYAGGLPMKKWLLSHESAIGKRE